jgi:hypothetical protein
MSFEMKDVGDVVDGVLKKGSALAMNPLSS